MKDRHVGSWRRRIWGAVFAIAIAVVAEAFLAIPWWTPYCDELADGPGAFGRGFPLPYFEPSTVTSMDIFLFVPAYLCNIAILAALFSVPLIRLLHWMERWRPIARRAVLLPIASLLCLSMAAQGLMFAGLAIPATIPSSGRYVDYRPLVLMDGKAHMPCDH
ncbi:hypothetical protein [Flavisphingomonas formosensis]|uniref:hypothetical protein n=1 Tax=Flavisphingomonas formosensis TaxID=861534 RepID=UPI0012FAF8DD|nr:hypothetical protein [Sphingomonas formosensis]